MIRSQCVRRRPSVQLGKNVNELHEQHHSAFACVGRTFIRCSSHRDGSYTSNTFPTAIHESISFRGQLCYAYTGMQAPNPASGCAGKPSQPMSGCRSSTIKRGFLPVQQLFPGSRVCLSGHGYCLCSNVFAIVPDGPVICSFRPSYVLSVWSQS